MAGRADKAEKKKLRLQLSLLQAIIGKLDDPAEQAIKVLKDNFSSPSSGPGPLDVEYKQVNESLDSQHKFRLEGENKKYLKYSPLMVAVLINPDFAKRLIDQGASVAFKNKDGLTALHVACNTGKLDMVDLLLSKSLEQRCFVKKKRLSNDCQIFINTKVRPKGWTPLMYAVKNGHTEVVSKMMECEYLDCSVKNRLQQNVYHIAAKEGHLRNMEPLWDVPREKRDDLIVALKSTDYKNWNVLHQLCTQENVEEVKWLLEEFTELKNKENLEQASMVGYTPFLVSCEYHKSEIVEYFLELHKDGLVDIFAKCHQNGDRGTTALHLAAIHNNKDLAALLVKAGCRLDTLDEQGNNILHVAMAKGNRRVAKFISDTCAKEGIDLESMTNNDGQHPKDVEEEITIPPADITRLGPEAVAAYEKALEEGKRKIPYCSMLILGESGVGKTSLYRQLVGWEFREDLESTKGIDNNLVDTMVEERSISIKEKGGTTWHETEVSTGETFAKAAGEETRKLMQKKSDKRQKSTYPSKGELLQVIKEIKKSLKPPVVLSSPASFFRGPSDPLVPFFMDSISRNPSQPSIPPPRETKSAAIPKTPSINPGTPEVVAKEPKPKPPPNASAKSKEDVDLPIVRAQPEKFTSHQPRQPPPEIPTKEPAIKALPRSPREMHITRRDGSIIAGVAKGRTTHDNQEQLILIALDFAGQSEYRPMHHCFITRRACYLVVFKLPDMVEFIANGKHSQSINNAWEELIYWVHSINAHIYSPDDREKDAMNKYRRIILVGTHRNDVNEKNLNDVDDFIKKKIEDDMRCVNHVCTVGNQAVSSESSEDERIPNYFIAVENSIDIVKRKSEYLSESGTKMVQEQIERMCNEFSFLKEDHPIKWLKFKERIEITATTTPVITIQKLKEMATASRIMAEDQQKLAIKFLHDSGKIICLDQLPHLFLREAELEELKGNIIVRPQWLISLMKEIMSLKLDTDCLGIDKTLVAKLRSSGEADSSLLKECWKDILEEQDVMSMRQLCLLLKVYCLIYPLNKKQKVELELPSQNGRARADELSRNENTDCECLHKYFLVPNMLPKYYSKTPENIPEKNWSSFYFDFKGFLPAQVYHRLLCRLLTEADSDSDNYFSRNECISDAEEKTWRIRWKEFDHVLEISIVGGENLEDEISQLHKDLANICCDSHLGGLTYIGGVIGINCSKCDKKLQYFKFSKGTPSTNAKCPHCKGCISDDQQLSKISMRLQASGKLPAYTDVDEKSMVVKHSPKKMTLDIEHYLSYSKNIEFILLARSSQGYNAATIYMERPIIEDANTDNTGTVLDSNAVVGSFAGAQVALIKADHTDNIKEVLTNVISHFPKAQHVISIGISKTIYRKDVKLADVLISSGVTSVQHCDISGDEPDTCITLHGNYIELDGLLQQIFNIDTNVEKDFKVDAVRTASYYYACNILESIGDTLMPITSATKIDSPNSALPVHFCVIGCDTDGTQLIQLRDEGKIKDFVLIKSAVAYSSTTDSNDEWKFTGAMAAVYCIQQKMASYLCTCELPAYTDVHENSKAEQHSPKKMTLDVEHYLSYSKNIEFILLARSSQGYNAATIYLERPIIEDASTDNTGTVLDSNAVVGSFAGAQVALIKADHTDNIKQVLRNAISHFPKAQHVISIGIGKTIYRKDVKLADVLISSGVTSVQHYDISGDESETCVTLNGNYIELDGLLQQIFNIDTKVEKDFKVDAVRTASYYYACNILESIDDTLMPKNSATKIDSPNSALPVHFCVIGCDTDGTQLIQLRDEGKIKDFVLIKSAVAYNSTTDSSDEWKFTGAMAAVYCIQQKMASYMYHKNSWDCYQSALESHEDDTLDVMVAKLIFLGASLQGKTVTRQRLTKKITNIESNQDRDCSNTGVSEQSTVMVCKKDVVRVTAVADSDDNFIVVDIEDEFSLCMNMSKIGTKASPQSQVSRQSTAAIQKSTTEKTPVDVSKLKSTKKESAVLKREEPKLPQDKMTPVPVASKLPVPAVTGQMIHNSLIRNHYSLEILKQKLDNGNLIYMQDTGGQPELMECLPALTIGPALYLLFCNLNSSLEECYQIGYRGSDGTVLPGKSYFTVKETMLTALASIASMSCSSYSADVVKRENNTVACVYVVGTHKDEVNDDAVDKYECELQEHLKATFFFEEGIIKWWKKGEFYSENSVSSKVEERLIYPIDNMNGNDEEMSCLRKSILDGLHTNHGTIKIPSRWLLFSIYLRKNEENVIELKSCFRLGAKLNMEEEDVKNALYFLHYNLGICMYFYNVPGLEDIVITNTQAVFKRLTVLIEAAYKTGELDKVARERFKESGKFSVSKFKVIGDDILPLETLVLILCHLNIIAPIQSSSGSADVYFMPCILRNASDKDLEEYQIGIPNVIPALFVYYTCGFVPLGIFPAMIANLFHQINENDSKVMDLMSKTLKRNFVQFKYGEDHDIVAITYNPQYIKVQISRQFDQCRHELHEVCSDTRNLVKYTLESVTSHMLQSLYKLASSEKQYKDNFEAYRFAFECDEHRESKHFCSVSNKDKNPRNMVCAEGKSVQMKPSHLLWYGIKLNPKESPESKNGEKSKASRSAEVTSQLSIDDLREVNGVCVKATVKWYSIGLELGVPYASLETINEDNPKNSDMCRTQMLAYWLRNSDNRNWKFLADVMGRETVSHPDIKDHILQKYALTNTSIH